MTPGAILEEVRRKPFKAFRIDVSDGSHHDVVNPEFCVVGTSYIIVCMSSNPKSPLFESYVKVDCRHVVKIYELPLSGVTGGNAQVS